MNDLYETTYIIKNLEVFFENFRNILGKYFWNFNDTSYTLRYNFQVNMDNVPESTVDGFCSNETEDL